MRPAWVTLTIATTLFAPAVRAQLSAEEMIAGPDGAPMPFPASSLGFAVARQKVVDALKVKLCPEGRLALAVKEKAATSRLDCPSTNPSVWTGAFHTIFFFLHDPQEQAHAWAEVDRGAGSQGEICVRIGVVLLRDGKPLPAPKGHFFALAAWAENVWKALDAIR